MTLLFRRFALLGLLAAGALGLAAPATLSGCRESSKSVPEKTYVVRGQVKVIYSDRHELEVHHEAIPDFVDFRGERVGMMSMVMPFGVDEKLALGDIAVGDKLELTIAVDWDDKPATTVTAMRKLPPDTALILGR